MVKRLLVLFIVSCVSSSVSVANATGGVARVSLSAAVSVMPSSATSTTSTTVPTKTVKPVKPVKTTVPVKPKNKNGTSAVGTTVPVIATGSNIASGTSGSSGTASVVVLPVDVVGLTGLTAFTVLAGTVVLVVLVALLGITDTAELNESDATPIVAFATDTPDETHDTITMTETNNRLPTTTPSMTAKTIKFATRTMTVYHVSKYMQGLYLVSKETKQTRNDNPPKATSRELEDRLAHLLSLHLKSSRTKKFCVQRLATKAVPTTNYKVGLPKCSNWANDTSVISIRTK